MVQVVRFTLRGKFAHFRRFYTNSSSLTYPIPPPTVVRGIVGGALGLSRSAYLETLADLLMAVRPLPGARARTLFQGINALKVVNSAERELRGLEPRTQIPTQFLLPRLLEDALGFEILLLPGPAVTAQELSEALRAPVYPPSLGTAYCLGWIEEIGLEEGELDDMPAAAGHYHGALYGDAVSELRIKDGQRLSRDRYPIRLTLERRIASARDLLVDLDGQAIECRYAAPTVRIGGVPWALIG